MGAPIAVGVGMGGGARPRLGGHARATKGSTGPPSMHLPPAVYAMFEPRDEPGEGFVPHWRPAKRRVRAPLTGVGHALAVAKQALAAAAPPHQAPPKAFDPSPKPEHEAMVPPAYALRAVVKARRAAESAANVQKRLGAWDPNASTSASEKTENAYRTLFVGRLSPHTLPDTLKAFMETFGTVTRVRIVAPAQAQQDDAEPVNASAAERKPPRKRKPYAFVEFAEEAHLQRAFRGADGAELDGAHIVVDVERGRTVSTWIPQRFGGGLGGPVRQKGAKLRRGRGPPEPPPPPKRFRSFAPRGPPLAPHSGANANANAAPNR